MKAKQSKFHPFQFALLFIVTLAISTYKADAKGATNLSGNIYLKVGDGAGYLQLGVNTRAPVIVYDEVHYIRTVDQSNTLVETVHEIPVTKQVVVPANTTQILVDNQWYTVSASPVQRILEIAVGTQSKVVHQAQLVEHIVYVPSQKPIARSQVVRIDRGISAIWVKPVGGIFRGGLWAPRYVSYSKPAGVIKVGGFWRCKVDSLVKPLHAYRHHPPIRVKVARKSYPKKKHRRWW